MEDDSKTAPEVAPDESSSADTEPESSPSQSAPDAEEAPVVSASSPAREEFRRVDTNQQTPSSGLYSSQKSGPGKPLLLILGLIVLLAIGATGYLLRNKFTKAEPSPTPTPELQAPAAEPSPTPSFDRSKFTIRVLNGTSTSGLAGSESAKLKDLGYKIGKTGNATSSSTPRTLVKVKASASGLLDALIKDLKPDYDASDGGALKDSDDVDGEVVLGSK